jgi:uncharacterized protein YjiS (DUF1127 family)
MLPTITPAVAPAIARIRKQQGAAASVRAAQSGIAAGEPAALDPLIAVAERMCGLVERAARTMPADAAARHLSALWQRFLAWQMRRATRLILQSLDRALRDIGLRRGEIAAAVRDLEGRKGR